MKLTDFGSSALPEEIYVRTRENGGTVLYAAPEFSDSVSRKGTFDDLLRGDIYSLGVLLYQLLTGQLPHDTPSQVRRHAPFKRPSEINANIVPMVDALILRCMERVPSARYQDIASLRSAFESARQQQLDAPQYSITPFGGQASVDWSTAVVESLETKDYLKAARVAEEEFARTHDSAALLQQLNALYRANRLFEFEEVFHREYKGDLHGDDQKLIRLLGIKAFLTLRKTNFAKDLIQDAERQDGESLELDFLRATLFGLEANFSEAREALERINRKCPSRPRILIRLIQVCEQMRDYPAAVGYLKHALRITNNSAELMAKRHRYQGLGLW
ncbi:protein kinase domain-containing protein [Pseudomonas aeruginosa]|uniref:protein kinase domain-containing protein n=1 Tax=Pseudomonas aeruginosa TaxID=287 RepID=UPI002260D9A4|nr:serine/threonine protein kinase [Pseudomonas aeruginosa]